MLSKKPLRGSGPSARSPLRRRVLRRHRDCLLRLVGARGRLARPPHLGRHRRRSSRGSSASGRSFNRLLDVDWVDGGFDKTCEELSTGGGLLSRVESGRVQNYLRILARPSSRWSRFFSGAAGHERDGFPILTLLTVLPLVGRGHRALLRQACARRGALHHAGLRWSSPFHLDPHLPADGSIGLVERIAWAPSLGIEYHLGVDGLGALMLVLSAIVTLMSVDAAHRVHHQPGLYFGLVLTLEVGPLRLLHRAQFLPLVSVLGAQPHPRILPHQVVGRPEARSRSHAIFRLHHGRLGGAAALVPRHLFYCAPGTHGLRPSRAAWPRPASSSRWSPRISGP